MDPRNYPQIVRDLLTQYSKGKPAYGDFEVETIFDLEHDRYQIVHMGWHHQRRVHHCVMHMDVRDGKIWIHHNTTEHELAIELMDLGVPKSDIVLGFCPPEMRHFTDFAIQ
jgi:XisI protein